MDVLSCSVCHKSPSACESSLLLCGRCKSVRYCGPACQRADWGTHKSDCKRFVENAKQTADSAEAFSSEAGAGLHSLFKGMNPAFAAYAAMDHGSDPPETYRPHAPLVPGGPEILPGWGAALHYKNCYMSALEEAVADINVKAIQALIAGGADPHARDTVTSWTPLHYAAMHPMQRSPTSKASKGIIVSVGAPPLTVVTAGEGLGVF